MLFPTLFASVVLSTALTVSGLSDAVSDVAIPVEQTISGVLEVRFKSGQQIRLRNGYPADISPSGSAFKSVLSRQILQSLSDDGAFWARSFPDVSERTLEKWRDQISAGNQKYSRPAVPDLNLYFRIHVGEGSPLDAVKIQLESMPEVDRVFRVPKLFLPAAPDYTATGNVSGVWQRYIDAAPDGIDARYAWSNNYTGAGIKVCDIEYDWNEFHSDLPAVSNLISGHSSPGYGDDHGTAVFGELVSKNDGTGTRGICYNATPYFAGTYVSGSFNIGNAVAAAAAVMSTGDVILIEMQISGPNGGANYVPVEWYEPYYDAIVTAVGKGIVVVEAAGNGFQNLDDPIYSTGNGGHYPFLSANDSGAIIVGAGAPPSFPGPRSRLDYSNFGETVDLQGWGYTVVTTGYGGLYSSEGNNKWYTATFSGTSSASPIVAGSAVILQQVYKQKFTNAAPPALIKQILQATGTPQSGSDNIGPLPDLEAALQAVNNPVDTDGDGVPDWIDNCSSVTNASQVDVDSDGIGDGCDNCQSTFNPGQENLDFDSLGDACDSDIDGDGVPNLTDNCLTTANSGQDDLDGDGVGDVCDPCNNIQPIFSPGLVQGSPVVSSVAGAPNLIGENFDFIQSGGFAGTLDQCKFGNFGQIYFNCDATNFYIGGIGLDLAGNNNAMALFLGINNLPNDKLNLWDQSGPPVGLDYMHNVAFSRPMDIAIVIGHEWGDGNFSSFNLGSGYDFGQGIYFLSTNSFVPMPGMKLAQFDGSGTVALTNINQDADELTDRWEACIPWAQLNVTAGVHSVTSLYITGVIASDGENQPDRYLSANVLASSVSSSSGFDQYGNYGFGFVVLDPISIDVSDVDDDGLPDVWEIQYFGTTTNSTSNGDDDSDTLLNGEEYLSGTQPNNSNSYLKAEMDGTTGGVAVQSVAGRLYHLYYSTSLLQSVWWPVFGATNVPGNGSVLYFVDPVNEAQRSYRVTVEMP